MPCLFFTPTHWYQAILSLSLSLSLSPSLSLSGLLSWTFTTVEVYLYVNTYVAYISQCGQNRSLSILFDSLKSLSSCISGGSPSRADMLILGEINGLEGSNIAGKEESVASKYSSSLLSLLNVTPPCKKVTHLCTYVRINVRIHLFMYEVMQ